MMMKEILEEIKMNLKIFRGIELGYIKGENLVIEPKKRNAEYKIFEILSEFYSYCDGISLPDIGQGIFIDTYDRINRKNDEFLPTVLHEANKKVFCFGSYGDGTILAIVCATMEVVELPPSKILDGTYYGDHDKVKLCSENFLEFLIDVNNAIEAVIKQYDRR